MGESDITPPEPESGPETPAGMISADRALQLILILLAIWTFFSGLALVFYQDAAAATIGGDLGGGEGKAAQRLLGVHLLVLAPIYGLLAWNRERYRLMLWIPYLAQTGVVFVTAFDIVTGDRSLSAAALPMIVAAIFLTLLVFVWRAGRLEILPETDLISRFISDDEDEAAEAQPNESIDADESDEPSRSELSASVAEDDLPPRTE